MSYQSIKLHTAISSVGDSIHESSIRCDQSPAGRTTSAYTLLTYSGYTLHSTAL